MKGGLVRGVEAEGGGGGESERAESGGRCSLIP
jgi:hypothetical protein